MASCLVTGHKGFIGSAFFQKIAQLGYSVKGIDLKDGQDILHCLPDEQFDFVFHFAALPRVEYSVENPSYTMKQNVLATSVLLEWAKKHSVKRVVFSSSSAIVGDGDGPCSPYGLHKLISEMECKLYSELYGVDTVCLRYFNVYSEEQEYGGAYSTAIAAWMEMIRQNKPLRLEGDGEQTRDLTYIDDVVDVNIFCMNYKENFGGQHFDVGTGTSVSMNYVKNFINQKCMVEWNYAPARSGDVRHTLANISELKKIGWEAQTSIDQGLEKCFQKENND